VPLSSQTVQQFFMTAIMGGVGQFASGGSGIQQQMRITTVAPGDLVALKDRVLDLGAARNNVKQLESAV
jgi:urease alpha subunit